MSLTDEGFYANRTENGRCTECGDELSEPNHICTHPLRPTPTPNGDQWTVSGKGYITLNT